MALSQKTTDPATLTVKRLFVVISGKAVRKIVFVSEFQGFSMDSTIVGHVLIKHGKVRNTPNSA